MYEQSLPIISALVICIIVCLSAGLSVITVVKTPLPTKPSATKMPENWKTGGQRQSPAAWMRQRGVAALDAKYTKGLADAKAENDALRDDVAAGRRRLRIKAICPVSA